MLAGVRCNAESTILKFLNVEALNVDYYYEIFARLSNETARRRG